MQLLNIHFKKATKLVQITSNYSTNKLNVLFLQLTAHFLLKTTIQLHFSAAEVISLIRANKFPNSKTSTTSFKRRITITS